MHLNFLDWTIIIGFFILIISVGLSYAGKAGKNMESFFLGGRNLPWYIAGLSMVATTFAADTPLAVTELVGKDGIAGNWLWWNMLAGGMLTTFFFARLWRRAGVLTEAELAELRYSGREASFLRGFKAIYLGVVLNVVVIAWVNVALQTLLEVFFELSPNSALMYTGVAMAFVAFYSSVSGLLGIAMTDVIQFCLAMFGCILLAYFVVDEVGGIEAMKLKVNNISPHTLNFLPTIGAGGGKNLALSAGAFFAYIGVQWWASWYPGAEPGGGGYIAQRMMSARTPKDAVYATLFFQIAHFCIRPWPWIIVALCVLVLYPTLPVEDVKYGYVYAMRDYLPAGLKGLLLVSFFAAYMSTISTQLNWGASYVINDVYGRFTKPKTDAQLVWASRVATVLLMIVGLGVTTLIGSISGAWRFIMDCGAGLGMVLILRWYWWRINAWSEITAMLAPFVVLGVLAGMAYGHAEEWWVLSESVLSLTVFPNSFFITVAFTTISWITVTFLTKPTKRETLLHFYNKVQPDGAWGIFGHKPENRSNLLNLTACWLSAISLAYSLLFFIGKLILHEWQEVLILGLISTASLFALQFFVGRTKILED